MKEKMKNYRAVMAVLIGTLILSFFGAVSVQAEVEKFSMGAGLGFAPDYEGSDDYTGVPMLYAHAQWFSVPVNKNGVKATIDPWEIECYMLKYVTST